MAINPGYPAANLRLAQSLQSTGALQESRAVFEAIVTSQPDNARALFGLGQVLVEQKEPEAAVQKFERAVALVPHYGAAHYALSQLYLQRGDDEGADLYRMQFERYANAEPPSDDPILSQVENLRQTVSQRIVQAGQLSAAGRFREAAGIFEAILQEDPKNVVAHINLIGLFGSTGQFDKAREHYESGRAIAPNDVKLHNNFGVLMLKQQRFEEAMPAFRAAISADPNYATPHRYLGLCLQELGQTDAALASYREAWRVDHLDYQSGYLIASLLLANDETEEAIATFQKILEPVSNKTPSYLRALARAHFINGDQSRSAEVLRKARSMASGFGQGQLVATIDEDLKGLGAAAGNDGQ